MLNLQPSDMKSGAASLQMFRNWVFSMGSLALIILLSLWLPATWMPLIAFALLIALMVQIRFETPGRLPVTLVMPNVVTIIMFWSGLFMLVLSIMFLHGVTDHIFDYVNPKHPYIPILVIAPVSMVVTGISLARGYRHGFFHEVTLKMGSLAEQGYVGAVLMQEGRHQLKMTFLMSLFLTVVDTIYYFFFYVEINLNTPDKFFFVWLPITLYAVSIGYMASRYFMMWMYYSQDVRGPSSELRDNTTVRYLIVDNEHFYLTGEQNLPDASIDNERPQLDTPAVLTFPYRERLPRQEAINYFRELSRIEKFNLRFMYASQPAVGQSNVFHYIVSLPSMAEIDQERLPGRWYALNQVNRLMTNKRVVPMLASEITRLYTITMAWKTYDRTGKRLYKVKNYRPTFRLGDINNWDVDFNDVQWLRVARYNEDTPFFAIRRLLRKVFNSDD